MTNTAALLLRPKSRNANGTQAMLGMGCISWTHGFTKFLMTWLLPENRPRGMESTNATVNPRTILAVLVHMSTNMSPLESILSNVPAIVVGLGSTSGLTPPVAERYSQMMRTDSTDDT